MSLFVMIQSGAEYLSAVSKSLQDPHLPNEDLVGVFDNLKAVESGLEGACKVARDRVMELVRDLGYKDENSLRLEIGEYELVARPRRLGPDPKLLEALIASKGLDVSMYMTPKVTYTVDDARLKMLLREGLVSQEEVNECTPPTEYNLAKPKRV